LNGLSINDVLGWSGSGTIVSFDSCVCLLPGVVVIGERCCFGAPGDVLLLSEAMHGFGYD
jgi:hypothetical protein